MREKLRGCEKMKKEKEDIPYRFWKEYEYLDTLKRGDKIKPIAEMIDKLHDLKDKKILATNFQDKDPKNLKKQIELFVNSSYQ